MEFELEFNQPLELVLAAADHAALLVGLGALGQRGYASRRQVADLV